MGFINRLWTGIFGAVAAIALALLVQIIGGMLVGLPIQFLEWIVLGFGTTGFLIGVVLGNRRIPEEITSRDEIDNRDIWITTDDPSISDEPSVARSHLWVRIGFCASFFLPALTLAVSVPFDHGPATDPAVKKLLGGVLIAMLLVSFLTPLVIIAIKKKSIVAKICQILLAVVVWVVIQACGMLAIGAALIGLKGAR